MKTSTFTSIKEAVDDIPVIDIHTHTGGNNIWQARNLTDLLYYHWLAFELRAAGCPDEVWRGALREQDPKESIRKALPYCMKAYNTTMHFALRGILKDLYGLDIKRTIDKSNYETVFQAVSDKAQDPSWEHEVLKRGKIEFNSVEYRDLQGRRNRPAPPPGYFTYAYFEPFYGAGLEGLPDQQRQPPGADFKSQVGADVKNAEGLDRAITAHISKLVRDHKIKALHVWLPYNWRYRDNATKSHRLDELIVRWDGKGNRTAPYSGGGSLTMEERNLLSSFSADVCARECGKHGLVIQMFYGSRSYGGLRTMRVNVYEPEWIRALIPHIAKHPETKFDLFLATRNLSLEMTVLSRMYPNLMASGTWWHGFTPQTYTTFYRDRLELLPYTSWTAFLSDAYCAEWIYGKLFVVKNRLSVALTQLVEEKFFSEEMAIDIAKAVLYENPKTIYGLG